MSRRRSHEAQDEMDVDQQRDDDYEMTRTSPRQRQDDDARDPEQETIQGGEK